MRPSIAPVLLLVLAVPLAAADHRSSRDPIALARRGAAALEDRRFGDALEAFREAATTLTRDPSVAFGAGVAAYMLGQNVEAEAQFKRALALHPGYAAPAIWLGELQYRAGRLPDAISTYETALRRSPGAPEIERRLARWRTEIVLQRRLRESRSAHFSVLFEDPADEPLAQRVLERIEAAYWRVGSVLAAYPSQPIIVVLYTDQQFHAVSGLAPWAVGAYDGRIHLPTGGALDQPEELDRVLTHEFVHAVVALLGGRTVPAWVNEGLATLLEPHGGEDPEAMLVQTGTRPALAHLHRGFVDLSAQDARVAYAYGARAVRRMLELRGLPALVGLLQDVGRGAPFASAFHRRMAVRYDDFAAMLATE